MSGCCKECQGLKPYAAETLEAVEKALRNVSGLRPGSADCDVNPMALNGPQGAATRALEIAHEKVTELFASLGVK